MFASFFKPKQVFLETLIEEIPLICKFFEVINCNFHFHDWNKSRESYFEMSNKIRKS